MPHSFRSLPKEVDSDFIPEDAPAMPKVRLPKVVVYEEKEYHLFVDLVAPYLHVVAYRAGEKDTIDDYLYYVCKDTIEECVWYAKQFFKRLRQRKSSGRKAAHNA